MPGAHRPEFLRGRVDLALARLARRPRAHPHPRPRAPRCPRGRRRPERGGACSCRSAIRPAAPRPPSPPPTPGPGSSPTWATPWGPSTTAPRAARSRPRRRPPVGVAHRRPRPHPPRVRAHGLRGQGRRSDPGVALVTDAVGRGHAPDGAASTPAAPPPTARRHLGRLGADDGARPSPTPCTHSGVALVDAVRAASTTPARLLGLDDRGAIAPGRRADLVALEPDGDGAWRVASVWVAGREHGALPAGSPGPTPSARPGARGLSTRARQ